MRRARLRHARTLFALALLPCLAVAPDPARAAARVPTGFVDELLAHKLNFPVAMAFLPDGRLLVTEKNTASIRMLVNRQLSSTPVAVMDSVRVMCGGSPCIESGLLGIAVDPGWPARPYLYTVYNWSGGPFLRLVRLTATGDLDHTGDGSLSADPAGEYLILSDLPDNSPIHNGGTLRFAPDGRLFMSVGDDFDICLAPVDSVLAGKLLRLDVSALPPGPGALADYALITPPDNPFVAAPNPRTRLVWASGLRNPWCFQIDPPTSRLFVPDVGEFSFEEVNLADQPGMKFGWPWYEAYARTTYDCLLADSTGSTAPFHSYDRRSFWTYSALMGMGVYRRPPGPAPSAFPVEYEGDFFFSDLGMGFVRRLKETNGVWAVADPVPGQPNATDWATGLDNGTDFTVGPEGALYYVRTTVAGQPNTGEIHRIHGPPPGATAAPALAAASFRLDRPFPSPSRGPLTVRYALAHPARARIAVHDLAGRTIRTLEEGDLEAGAGSLIWDGRDQAGIRVAPGVYAISLATPSGTAVRRCVLVR